MPLLLSPRERKIFAMGIAVPVLGLSILAHFNLKLPWYPSLRAWNPDLDEEIISVQTGKKSTNLYKYFYKDGVNIKKDKRFDYENLQDNLAIVCCPGVGDIPRLMFPAIHQKFFPTDHFYVVSLEDWEKKRVLATSLGQKNDVIRTLIALRYINDQGKYQKIALFGESRGGAIVIQVIRMLQRIKQNLEPNISQAVNLNQKEAENIIEKIQKTGIILKNPLLSIRSTARKMLGRLLWVFGKYVAAPLLTGFRYSPFALPEPVDAALDWNNREENNTSNIPVLFVSAEKDEVLGNELDEQFLQNLQTSNGEEHSHRHVAKDSTHIQPPHDPEYEKKVWNMLQGNDLK